MSKATQQKRTDWEWENVYEPLDWEKQLGYKRLSNYCSYPAYDCRAGFHQCDCKRKEEITGYGFCKQHAKMVRKNVEK